MDRFPEAFERFERQIDITKCKSFQEVLGKFQEWQNYEATYLQQRALIIETKDLIQVTKLKQLIKYSYGFRSIYRDIKTGRFTKA